jgi:hypothetical protein
LLLLAGCNNWPHNRGDQSQVRNVEALPNPKAEQLVAYLNDNARRVQSVHCNDLDIDAKQGFQSIGLRGRMVCQKPRNFRLKLEAAGNSAGDLGSNDQEFWYWISKSDPPYLFHCAYDDFRRGNVAMPFPFQPDWIIEALGVAEYDPAKNYRLTAVGKTLELEEQSVSPQGQPVYKVTVFNRVPSSAGRPQVQAYKLLDMKRQPICVATITDVQVDPGSGAVLPHRVQLSWPAEKAEMRMKLDGIRVNAQISNEQYAVLFSRPSLVNVPSFDLARRTIDGQPNSLTRVRGQRP